MLLSHFKPNTDKRLSFYIPDLNVLLLCFEIVLIYIEE